MIFGALAIGSMLMKDKSIAATYLLQTQKIIAANAESPASSDLCCMCKRTRYKTYNLKALIYWLAILILFSTLVQMIFF